VAEGVTQGSRRGRIPRVRSERAERWVKKVGMSWEGPARLMGVSTSAISGILQENSPENQGVIQLPLSHGMNVRNAKSGI
jgi:predicted transcriptional regulator